MFGSLCSQTSQRDPLLTRWSDPTLSWPQEQLASANARLKDAKDEVDRLYAITQAQSQSESPPSGLSGSPRSGKRRDRSPSAALGPLSPNSTRSRSQSGSHGDILNDLFGAVDDGVKEARTPRQGELRRKGLN